MTTPHQVTTYNQLQGARPCDGRGELNLKTKHEPASACCKAKDIVESASFYCTILKRNVQDINVCWACSERKSNAG